MLICTTMKDFCHWGLQSYEGWTGRLKNKTAVLYWYTDSRMNLAPVQEGLIVKAALGHVCKAE